MDKWGPCYTLSGPSVSDTFASFQPSFIDTQFHSSDSEEPIWKTNLLRGYNSKESVYSSIHPFSTQNWILTEIPCRGPASAESRGYPQDEWRRREREDMWDQPWQGQVCEGERERERESDQTQVFAGSGRVWQCFIFYHGFYTLS